jgi:demethylmenaquinone methyltransferase/2-methoxy-6-polyprenyl-1,4-benzoquinol methylase
MFDGIARRYDLVNRVLSLGLDQRWRRLAAAALDPRPGEHILDVATGTGDLALAILGRAPSARVVGVDPSPKMLARAHAKLGAAAAWLPGDARDLPFADSTFDGVTIGFGIRNVPDRGRALAEMARVLRPGGRAVILELAEPSGPLARAHVHRVVPLIGALLSSAAEYRYLQRSIAAFPPPAEFAAEMAAHGLPVETIRGLTLGVAQIFVGRRP